MVLLSIHSSVQPKCNSLHAQAIVLNHMYVYKNRFFLNMKTPEERTMSSFRWANERKTLIIIMITIGLILSPKTQRLFAQSPSHKVHHHGHLHWPRGRLSGEKDQRSQSFVSLPSSAMKQATAVSMEKSEEELEKNWKRCSLDEGPLHGNERPE